MTNFAKTHAIVMMWDVNYPNITWISNSVKRSNAFLFSLGDNLISQKIGEKRGVCYPGIYLNYEGGTD